MSNENEHSIYSEADKSKIHNIKPNKSDMKVHILLGSIYIKFQTHQTNLCHKKSGQYLSFGTGGN